MSPTVVSAVFDDDFVVDVHHDLVPCSLDMVHGVGERVAGDGLDDVLDEFPATGLELAPLAALGDAVIDDGGAAEPVLTQPWPRIGQLPP